MSLHRRLCFGELEVDLVRHSPETDAKPLMETDKIEINMSLLDRIGCLHVADHPSGNIGNCHAIQSLNKELDGSSTRFDSEIHVKC